MLTTEKKAGENWCPMVRTVAATLAPDVPNALGVPLGAATFNRAQGPLGMVIPDGTKCVASGCMMWRWGGKVDYMDRTISICRDRNAMDEPERPKHVPASWTWCPYDADEGDSARWVEPEAEMLARREGYCGLAGTPGGAA